MAVEHSYDTYCSHNPIMHSDSNEMMVILDDIVIEISFFNNMIYLDIFT